MNHVLMIVRNCLHFTINSLASLQAQTIPVKVWVINENSTDGTALWLDRHTSETLEVSHFQPQHRCLSAAWNYGLNRLFCQTDRVLVVNNDTLFSPDTYERLLAYQLETGRHFVTGVSSDRPPEETPEEGHRERPHPDFSCFLIDKQCWNHAGEFDTHFIPAFREDQSYHRSMIMAGIEAVCIDVPFQHFRSATIKNNPKDAKRVAKWSEFREVYYKLKWGALWPNETYTIPFNGQKHVCPVCVPPRGSLHKAIEDWIDHYW